eukprot:TRINITY_DN8313_c0_g2_i1.p1 TRINITY_DN8313_c0_g2~~TRINITY_DN8313_c0_g2_i1.p1  ORF type:complete len:860 (+),score=101.96 TRINITY_DN8313_c0_g2_i1:39-2582(+)
MFRAVLLLVLSFTARSQVSIIRDGVQRSLVPETSGQLNGHIMTSIPNYLKNATFYNPMTIFQKDDSIILECSELSGCTFHVVSYRCNRCTEYNGGMKGLDKWTMNGGDCAPSFRSNGYKQPMVAFRKYFGTDTRQTITMTSEARYVGIFHFKGNTPDCPMCEVEPELLDGCNSHCAGNTNTEVTIPELGKVLGKVEGNHVVFRGVPYASEPEMFTRSSIVTRYENEIDGTINGPMCWQPGSTDGNHTVVNSLYNETGGFSWQESWSTIDVSNSSTDCLNLNIFVPLKEGNYPVMVFIPGGGFYGGGSNDKQLDKSFSDSVILVIMNYRLGVHGFGLLDEMLAQGGGNFGLTDQQVALQYVKQFISAFGGDDNKITIFGESAGGTSVAYHYVTPASQAFFNRAILQSAGTAQINTVDWEKSNTLQLAAMVAYSDPSNVNCSLQNTYTEYTDYLVMDTEEAVLYSGYTQVEVQRRCNTWFDKYHNCTGYDYIITEDGTLKGKFITMPVVMQRNQVDVCSTTQETIVAMRPIDPTTAWGCLTSASPEQLVRYATNIGVYPDTFFHNKWSPVIDGVTLNKTIPDLIDAGMGGDIDVLTGSNLDEGTFFITCTDMLLDTHMNRDDFLLWVDLTFGGEVRKLIDINNYYDGKNLIKPLPLSYSDNVTSLAYNSAVRAGGDSEFRCRSLQILEASSSANKFLYHFQHTSSLDSNNSVDSDNYYYGCYHGLELEYLFQYSHPLNSLKNAPANNSQGEYHLMKHMACFWSNFAETGSPNIGSCNLHDVPFWQPYDQDKRLEMIFKAGNSIDESQLLEVGDNYDRCQALLLKQIPGDIQEDPGIDTRGYCDQQEQDL